MPFTDTRVLTPFSQAPTPEQLRLAMTQIAGFIDNPIADVLVTPEDTSTTPRTITLQVRDRLNVNWKGRWWLRVCFGSTEWARDGSLTITVTSSAISIPIVADQVYDILTNSDGTATLTIDGADGTYYLTSTVFGRAQSSSVAITTALATSGTGWLFNDAANSAHVLMATWE